MKFRLQEKAPITESVRAQLRLDTQDLRATAARKSITIDDWEVRRQATAAKNHFELGCWLYHLRERIGRSDEGSLHDRIECAWRIFMSGITNPGYQFVTVFEFGERQFGTIFGMGDGDQVVDGLRSLLSADRTGRLAAAFDAYGWPRASKA